MKKAGLAAAAVIGGVVLAGAAAIALADTAKLKNAGFESNSFRAWNVHEDGGGNWLVYRRGEQPPTPGPPRGLGGGLNRFPNPPQGKRAAFVVQDGPGVNILHRVIRPRKGAENRLQFFLYYRNTAGEFRSPNNLEPGSGPPRTQRGAGPGANQQLRVDLMKRGAPLLSLEPRHVLATLLRTRPGDDLRRPYSKLKVNLTQRDIRKPFRLRIAEVDNLGPFYVGVDALKLKYND